MEIEEILEMDPAIPNISNVCFPLKSSLAFYQIQEGDYTQKEAWKRYDWEFHLALIQACGSKNLLALHEILYDKYLRYQMLVLANRGEEAIAEHKEMLNAAIARDASAATEALKRHIEKGLEHTLEAF